MTEEKKDEDKLTRDEILLLRDMIQWWRRARILQFENWIKDEKDPNAKHTLMKGIDILKSMK